MIEDGGVKEKHMLPKYKSKNHNNWMNLWFYLIIWDGDDNGGVSLDVHSHDWCGFWLITLCCDEKDDVMLSHSLPDEDVLINFQFFLQTKSKTPA